MNDLETYLLVFFRIITIMLLLLFSTLFIMGKRPIGELPVFDLLTIVVMGAIVGADIADPKIKHLPTAFAVIILALFQRLISLLAIKNKTTRRIITFEPTLVVKDGRLIHGNIKKINYSIDDILMLFREKDIFDLGQVAYGIIEANGNISVLKKPQFEAVSPEDLQIEAKPLSVPLTVILDGELHKRNMLKLKMTEADIMKKLYEHGYTEVKKIFFATMDNQGNMNLSPYDFYTDAL